MQTTQVLSGTNPVGAVADRAHQAIDRVAEKATPLIDRASSAAHRSVDQAADAAKPAAEWVSTNGQALAVRSTALTDACSSVVRERPLVAVAGALALGYLVGKMMR